MKKKVTKTVVLCDSCHREDYTMKCLGCGKDFCYDCQTKKGVTYPAGVFTSGSGDGFYCRQCDAKKEDECDPLHLAFFEIKALRLECENWNKDFNKRKVAAENRLAEINPN